MSGFGIYLTANNSSQAMRLHFDKQLEGGETEYFFCLTGDYQGEHLQVDFDVMKESDVKLLIAYLQSIVDGDPTV